jgi:hypothetical protein
MGGFGGGDKVLAEADILVNEPSRIGAGARNANDPACAYGTDATQ